MIDTVWPLQTGLQLAQISPYHYLKRLFDVVVSGFLLLICAPLLPLIVILIWTESGKPVIFRQPRVGGEGQMFIAYQFRTMFTRSAAPETAEIYTRETDT